MSLRYRLFLWVAAIFTVAFVISLYWEEHATRKNLEVTYKELLIQLDQINQQKTDAIEDYLSDMLFKIQAEVDAVLLEVAKYQLVRKGFEPTTKNLLENNWLDSASLMITNKWIDFIQSTNEGSLMSEIIINKNSLSDSIHIPINSGFHLIAVRNGENKEKWDGPYIGIALDISSLHGDEKKDKESDKDYFVFFTREAIQSFEYDDTSTKNLDLSINLLEPFLKWLELPAQQFYLKNFIDKIMAVQKRIRENPEIIPNELEWHRIVNDRLKSLRKGKTIDETCFSLMEDDVGINETYSRSKAVEKQMKFYVKEYIDRYNKVGLIWGLSTLTNSNVFGKTPLSDHSPLGMGVVDDKTHYGKSLLSDSVFYNKVAYPARKEIKGVKNATSGFLATHLDVISFPEMHHVFFGNTLRLEAEEHGQSREGYLTVGTHGGEVLESLSRSTHQPALFISDNKVIAATNALGSEVTDPAWYDISPEKLLSAPSGIVTIKGEEYFFLHIEPYKSLDVHFFLFKPKAEEYALINSVRKEAKEIVEKISMQMRLASIAGLLFVLVLLNNIAKRITRPITYLAEVTKTVAEGKLDAIEIPNKPKKKTKDEIYSLYHSFFEMIKGLREKEKVRGILNKVVSEEIAEEALKGNIQLGGEEKRVTVLFADIRGFSEMTEKMDPKEVIHLINTCMTKVSKKIDAHDGVIDKYVGDEVMALFGAPIEKPKSALQAIQSALDMVDEINKWNLERKQQGLQAIEMGIGIHTGNVVAGNMGADNRLNYTVLGANVNLAARICSEAEGMQVLISENTLESEGVKNNIECEKFEAVQLKGFTDPIAIYSVKSYRKNG
ncbi:adenylate/guanylate cyclase domain-containing protein [Candidatus Neptunichlamydia sp. REUL1]|uniref:adenylate/guanylate cyclase domain-containing protein n=1 Tax=Candidatus Neptunichlamydia sp. REUL1 TaxID=3064277 RepID=UPI00292D8EF5|nr:adenylate/guanylate cyclase domain-containing protein [Candidatus Neptunochlamydia sp. REUL1]